MPGGEGRGPHGCPLGAGHRDLSWGLARGTDQSHPTPPPPSPMLGYRLQGLACGIRWGHKQVNGVNWGASIQTGHMEGGRGTGPPNSESEAGSVATRVRGGPKGREALAYRSPPKRVGIGGEVGVGVLLSQVDQEGGEDQHQEPDVPGGDELLRGQQRVRPPVGPRRRAVRKRDAEPTWQRWGGGGPQNGPERCWEGNKKFPTLRSSQAPFSTPRIRDTLSLLPATARSLKQQGPPRPRP